MEAGEQREFVKWFRQVYAEHSKSLRVSMSGMSWHGAKGARMWSQMKSQGVAKGEPDIAILIPRRNFHCLLIEHKGEKQSHKLTPEQRDHLEYHNSIGNLAIQTRGLDDLKEAVTAYMES